MHIGATVAGIGALVLAMAATGGRQEAMAAPGPITLEAEAARLDPERVEIVPQESFPSKRGVSLKGGVAGTAESPAGAPDLVFTVKAPRAGRYWISSHSAVDAVGAEAMRKASGKGASLRLWVCVDDGRPTRRVLFVPWSPPGSCQQALGKFDFSGRDQEIRVWLPEGVRLDWLQIAPYAPPKAPDAAAAYQPTVVPPKARPRLWVNAESLPHVRANLEKGENAPIWAKVREQAAKPFEFRVAPNAEVGYSAALEQAAVNKAFVYLMAGDRARGREAVTLIRDYLAAVQFDNLLDITREIGRAIYSASLVYDWCYDLMAPEERESIRKNLMRLADDMEIGWPPFRQMIANGHGNEAQVNRDLLCMGIALYDEDPVPYRLCAYRILEELVPMRRFEYQSPRHNQGISYGPYRFGWDMHSAWLFRRMTGKPVFDDNIGGVYKFWLYMRLPIGQMLRDGDGFSDGQQVNLGLTPLLVYAYTGDPIIKGDFIRQGGFRGDPMMILLLNDPDLAPQESLASLPQTLDFGPALGSMVARTGWNLGSNLSDVVVEMKGGGYHFGNHQHCDAGSFQIYYRGLQAADLGQYKFYGTPYDYNFCKRSVSHSLMLVVDPEEKLAGTTSNDGGTRSVRSCPATPDQATSDPLFANGKKVSASFGPLPQRPFFSYFSVDLKSAYSEKIREYVRTFCFLNLDNEQTPAALIVLDNVTAAKPEFRKFWQVNTLNPPEQTADGVILRNSALGLAGKVDVRMLLPRPEEREVQVLSGEAAHNVFGQQFAPPAPDKPEGHGHRVLFSPRKAQAGDVFLAVMPMSDEKAAPLPVSLAEGPATFALTLAGRVVILSKSGKLLDQPFQVSVPAGKERQVLLAGLAPGEWSVRTRSGKTRYNARVEEGRNTAFFLLPGGEWEVRPEAIPGAPVFQAKPDFMPAPAASLAGRVLVGGQVLAAPPTRAAATGRLLPTAALKALGMKVSGRGGALRVSAGDRAALFQAGAESFDLNGHRFKLPAPAVREGGEWFVPDGVAAALAGLDLARDGSGTCVELTPSRIPHADDVLWIEANKESDLQALRLMLADIPGRQEYWTAEGRDVQVDLTLTRPLRLKGVGIQWHLGATRQAKFALETSLDGATWRKVFDGSSSGKSAALETYAFDPHEARYVRLHGYGNTEKAWNSIVHFRLLPAEAED